MATARSPSPNPSRAKTPDSSRRSTKPSISIDPHLRNSCSKENEKRATVHSSGKASKNFMAPTISAASKVAAPSPRKKILQERNEVSESLETANLAAASSLRKKILQERNEVSESLETANLASPKIFGGSEPNASSSYKIKSRNSVSSPPPADADADADADPDPYSVPPYDPKTNYLSPRPQFLHYRPNPRINNYVSTVGEFLEVGDNGKRLEASFSSESDDDGGTKCSTPCVPSEEEEEEETEEALDDTLVVEPEPESKPEPLLPRRSKLVPFLLLVAIACVFIPLSDSPVISSSVPNDQSLTRLYNPPSGMYEGWRLGEYRAIASVKVHDLASRFKRWSSDSLAYFSSAASHAGEVGFVGLVNTTSPAQDDAMCSDFIYKHEIRTEPELEHEFEVLEVVSEESAENEAERNEVDVFEDIIEIDDTEHEAEGEAIEVEVSGAVNEVAEFETELVQEEAIETESEALDEDAEFQTEEAENGAMETELVLEEVSEAIETESEALDEDTEFQTDVLEAENSAMENVEYEAENIAAEFRADKFETKVPENGATGIDGPNTENHQDSSHIQPATSSQLMVGLSAAFLLLVVAAGAAFLCVKQKRTSIATKETHTGKKAVGPVSDSWRTYTPTKGEGSPPLQHLRGNEDLTGDSVASSGLDNNTFSDGQHHQTRRGEDDDDSLSHERRPRRDSTASSSTSYGSFTTYERFSARKGYKDEESVVVTPVRRSSRLRSHVTTSS